MANSLGVRSFGFADAPDYIEKITYAIWNGPDRDPGLIGRYYGADTAIHMDGGDLCGADAVIANTEARLVAFPDFHGQIDDTIWTGDEKTGYRTSMRWTWTGTNAGPSAFGPATGRRVAFTAIADCVIRGEMIVEEWLGANPLDLARQLGLTEQETLQAVPPPLKAAALRPLVSRTCGDAGEVVADSWTTRLDGSWRSGADDYAPDAVVSLGPQRLLRGRDEITGWSDRWRALAGGLTWSLIDQYSRPARCGDWERVATRWALEGNGMRLSGISHHRVLNGKIMAEWTQYDELSLLAQGAPLLP
ncbi:ester cyclase [Actinomadura nitritigenes]|uniref:nuclear transport factor 2 family protein n=1 Tax=Actinomadura nitritigenes TaxID=134602 RepID=UPI003D94F720